jgi:chromosome segregation protein
LVEEEITRSTQFSRIQAAIEAMNLELEDKDKEISRLREAYLQVKEKVNRKESVLESMAGEKRIQVELENRLKNEKEDLGRRLEELQKEKGTIKEKIETLKQTSINLEDEISIIDTRVKNRHQHLKRIKEEYEDARASLNSGMSKEMSLTQESGYLSKRIGESTDSRSRLEKEKDEVRLKIEHITSVSQRKTQVREAFAQKLEEIDEDIARANQNGDALDQKKKRHESDLKFAEADLNIFESRLTSLRSLTENFEGYKLGVRSIMKATDLDARREGRVIGLVADVIQVDPKLEQAVEAVMGDKLQYIIVESQQDGKDAVNYLKERTKGRSSFIPLKDLNENGHGNNGNGLPLLRDLVSVPDSYRTLINHLLENASLVDDLDQAVSLWASNGKDRSLVTPDGDVVDKSGVISGGKLTHSSHGLLARKREISELKIKVVEYKKKVDDLTAALEKVDVEIEEKKTSLKALTEEKWRCQDEINDLDKVIFRFSHELDQLEKLMVKISGDLEQKDKEQHRHKEALSKIESELELCKEKRQRAEAYVSEKEFELKECEEEFEQFRNEQAQLKMDFGLSKEEERGLKREVERIDDFTLEAQQTFKRIEEDISGAKQRYQATIEKEEGLREELTDLYERLAAAEELVNRAEQDRNQFVNTIREQENQGEDLRGEIDALKEKIHVAEMEQSEVNFRVNSLEETVKEKFDLDLKEIYGSYVEEDFTASDVKEKLENQKTLKERLGEVNLMAIQEHEALKERFTFITEQRDDLLKSIESLTQAIKKINKTSKERFLETFEAVDQKLQEVFPILFNGGHAGLRMIDETKPLETGVLVEVQPPGKKVVHMGLLSGGEKALVAMALLFAIYLIKPSPFCLLDEVDAPLDEANIDRFNDLLQKIKANSQIILVTHNRRSMEIVDRLYGITMEKQGVSKLVTVDLQGVERN